MSILSIKNASTGYGNKQVLFNVSLDVEKGDTILLVGSNGSGKSTLLKLIYGLVDVWQGSVDFNGEVLYDIDIAGQCPATLTEINEEKVIRIHK